MDRLYERAGPGPAVGSRRVDGAVAARSARARGLPVRVGRRRRRSAADGGAAARASERDRGAPVADARGGRHRRRRLAARRRLRRLARRGAPARLGPDVDLRGARALPREQPVRRPRRPRHQAERLATEGDEPSRELSRALADPIALLLNYGSFLAALAILALMIWKPA